MWDVNEEKKHKIPTEALNVIDAWLHKSFDS